MILHDLVGKCLFCGKNQLYDTHPNAAQARRHCCTGNLALPLDRLSVDLHLFPTVFPVPAAVEGATIIPPHPASRPVVDGLAVAAEDFKLDSPTADPSNYLPFLETALSRAGYRCGNALLYDAGRLATRFHLARGSVKVLDMSTYGWSHTLKDPRSWAVVAQAARSGVRHLAAWTAGNAGFSLARMAYAHNKFVDDDKKLSVHCYTIGGAVPDNLKVNLQRYNARVVDFQPPPGGLIFPPDHSFERIATATDALIKEDEYWEVTDGWDGIGLYMYRLIGRQICAHYKPNYVICPLGTGDLFFGLYQGRKDCLEQKLIPPDSCKFLVMVPNQGNILDNYNFYGMQVRDTYKSAVVGDYEPPMAPKLEANYTPLLLAMYEAFLDPAVRLVPVGRKGQDIAARAMFKGHMADFVASEPSSLLAFSGLAALVGLIVEGAFRLSCG